LEKEKRKMKFAMYIRGNQGYGYDQVRGMTVGELIEVLKELDPNDELFLKDEGNSYGANWHSFPYNAWEMFEEIYED
jgi:hypothetical protein